MRPLGSGARRNRWGAAVRPKRPPRVTRSLSGSESSPMPPTDVTISSPDARNRPSSQPRSRSIAARAHVDQSVHPRLLRPRGPGHDVQWPPRERDKAMMLRSAFRSSMRPSIPPTRRRQQHMHRRVAPPSPGTSSRRLVDSSNRRRHVVKSCSARLPHLARSPAAPSRRPDNWERRLQERAVESTMRLRNDRGPIGLTAWQS